LVFFIGVKIMSVTIESSGSLIVAYLIGEIDHHTASLIREKIDNTISFKKPSHLILDFKNVTFMDSSGIGLVMGRYRLMQNFKGTVEIRNVSPRTKKLMELAGLGSIAIIKEF
jgi:anti-anti-sigma factor